MEDITTKLALDYLSKELEKQEDYYNAWVNAIKEEFVFQWEHAQDPKDIETIGKNTAEGFLDFLIKEYASE